jgi:hypothetical protein
MSWCIMGPFLKFGGVTLFLILVLTNYEEWGGDGSTQYIPQTKKKTRSEKMMDQLIP